MEKSLFLTGCCGFIGLNFLKQIYQSGFYKNYKYIYNLDKQGYATKYNMNEYNLLVGLFNQEIMNKFVSINMNTEQFSNLYKFIYKDIDIMPVDIVSFASESHVDNSIQNPNEIFLENCRIPGDIFTVFKNKINTYYHISTDEVYGDISLQDKDNKEKYFKTTSLLKPSNPYSASKASQDLYLNSLSKTFGVNVVFIRMANQYGFHQHPEKMIPASILRALRGETIKIYGKGENCRQWTFVEDTVKFIESIVSKNILLSSNVVHVAQQDNIINNNDLVSKVIKSLKRHNIDSKLEYITDRLGHDEMYALLVGEEHKQFFNSDFETSLDKVIDYYFCKFNLNEYNG